MIQLRTSGEVNRFRVSIYDKMTNVDYRPLIELRSQQSGKISYCIPLASETDTSKKERFIKYGIVPSQTADSPTFGFVKIGTADSPYGFYDFNMYQNTSNTNLDPTGLTRIYTGLMNLEPAQTGDSDTPNPAVTYTEYTNNDSDTDNVYLTNLQPL